MPRISEVALEAHCRRVAGWATELAHPMACSTEELDGLEKAALWHHYPPLLLRQEPLERIASDLRIQLSGLRPSVGGGDERLSILQAFHGLAEVPPREEELAKILDWADQLDQEFELRAWDPVSPEMRREFFQGMPRLPLIDAAAMRRATHSLPVFPPVAQKAMRLLATKDAGFEQVERVIDSDRGRNPVLAAELLRAANTASAGPPGPLTTLPAAIAHIGAGPALRTICAASLRPVFASRNLYNLWNHSLDAAQVAEEFALLSNCAEPAEAFLAGLIHDIGRLAFSLLSGDYQVRSQRLLAYGCPPLLVEQALTGTCHAEIGAELLREWALPPQIAEAVESHHDPVESAGPLGAILYVTELRTMSNEDLPSSLKLERALKVLDISRELVVGSRLHSSSSLGHLKFPAAS